MPEPFTARPSPRVEGPAPSRTGDRRVDEVLASLDGLPDLPVSDHVAVLESAHDRLRAALTDAGDTGPSATGS